MADPFYRPDTFSSWEKWGYCAGGAVCSLLFFVFICLIFYMWKKMKASAQDDQEITQTLSIAAVASCSVIFQVGFDYDIDHIDHYLGCVVYS